MGIRRINIRILFTSLFILGGSGVVGQTAISGYLDMGTHNASEGLFLKTAGLLHYDFGRNHVKTGIQFDLFGRSDRAISGFTMGAARNLVIKDFLIEVESFFLWSGHSWLLRETNWGMWLDFEWPHFNMCLGTEFRSYAFTAEAVETYDFQRDDRIRENWNLLYHFGYNIKPADGKWNAGISITNLDHFFISQDTNPVFKISGRYRAGKPLDIFLEGWYKSAGAFNMSVNYFGFFIRTGMIWVIR